MSKIFLSIVFCMTIWSCGETKKEPTIYEGTIEIAVDDAVKPIIDAQINAYKIHYPKATIKAVPMPENVSIHELFTDSTTLMAGTREFNAEELEVLKSRGIDYKPARMALDAVALIASNNFGKSEISLSELKTLFTDKSSKVKLVFDQSNSANLNFIKDKLGLETIDNEKVFAANGNLDVIEALKKNANAIGFIGFNWISETRNTKIANRLNGVKLLSVAKDSNSPYFELSRKNLKERNYPLERFIYLHTFKEVWGIEKGFVRFCCSKIGQLVTEKMGLVPFYIIPKEFLLDTQSDALVKDDKK